MRRLRLPSFSLGTLILTVNVFGLIVYLNLAPRCEKGPSSSSSSGQHLVCGWPLTAHARDLCTYYEVSGMLLELSEDVMISPTLYSKACWGGNCSDVSAYTMQLGGDGPSDWVSGDVYSGENITDDIFSWAAPGTIVGTLGIPDITTLDYSGPPLGSIHGTRTLGHQFIAYADNIRALQWELPCYISQETRLKYGIRNDLGCGRWSSLALTMNLAVSVCLLLAVSLLTEGLIRYRRRESRVT